MLKVSLTLPKLIEAAVTAFDDRVILPFSSSIVASTVFPYNGSYLVPNPISNEVRLSCPFFTVVVNEYNSSFARMLYWRKT